MLRTVIAVNDTWKSFSQRSRHQTNGWTFPVVVGSHCNFPRTKATGGRRWRLLSPTANFPSLFPIKPENHYNFIVYGYFAELCQEAVIFSNRKAIHLIFANKNRTKTQPKGDSTRKYSFWNVSSGFTK